MHQLIVILFKNKTGNQNTKTKPNLIKGCLTMLGVIILTQNINMELISISQKLEPLVFEGCGYIKHRQLTDSATSWYCRITKCNSRVRLRNVVDKMWQQIVDK